MCVVIVAPGYWTLLSLHAENKNLTIIPEKWYQLLTRGGRLRQGPNKGFNWENPSVFKYYMEVQL